MVWSLKDVCLVLGGRTVLDRVSLNIPEAAITSIIGPNASGKSSIIRLLSADLRPSSGTIDLMGGPLSSVPVAEMAKTVSVVRQNASIPFEYTCMETVLMGRYPHIGMASPPSLQDVEIAHRWMNEFELMPLASTAMTEISGGEAQRVLMARAVAQTPRAMLLDESMSAMDPYHELKCLKILRWLSREQGVSIVMVTHDLTEVSLWSDFVVALKAGRVMTSGRTDEVIQPDILEELFSVPAFVSDQGSVMFSPQKEEESVR